jgi:endonuclease-3
MPTGHSDQYTAASDNAVIKHSQGHEMPKAQQPFQTTIDQLKTFYGHPKPPAVTDPLEMILLENVAYLVDDEQREEAFAALRDRVGLSPVNILSASDEELSEVAWLGGMHPDGRVNKLRTIAQIALQEFEGDFASAIRQSAGRARKSLKKFPGIGEPGAEKILLFARIQPALALESNGLRVMIRLGFGDERKNYTGTYRSAQESVAGQVEKDFDWLVAAHQLLRQHGRELCKNAQPRCKQCPLTRSCRFFKENLRDV